MAYASCVGPYSDGKKKCASDKKADPPSAECVSYLLIKVYRFCRSEIITSWTHGVLGRMESLEYGILDTWSIETCGIFRMWNLGICGILIYLEHFN